MVTYPFYISLINYITSNYLFQGKKCDITVILRQNQGFFGKIRASNSAFAKELR